MKKIALSQGKESIVDDDWYEVLSQVGWFAAGYQSEYAARNVAGGREFMHRVIMDAPKDMCVDHINGNPLDNRRENLRLCTHANNMRNNKGWSKNTTSMYKGVSWDKKRKKWQAKISKNGKTIALGRYSSEQKAALAYNEAAKKHHGEFARQNIMGGQT